MPFNSDGTAVLGFAAYTTAYLENLLVTNPAVQTFPLSINAEGLNHGIGASNPGAPCIDVTRAQILKELQNRIAVLKQNSQQLNNIIVDNASLIGAVAQSIVPAGEDGLVLPAIVGVGGPNPVQLISQVA